MSDEIDLIKLSSCVNESKYRMHKAIANLLERKAETLNHEKLSNEQLQWHIDLCVEHECYNGAKYIYNLLNLRKLTIMEKRNCGEVIKNMMTLIPSDKTDFIKDLEWNYDDANLKAPEETLQWNRTSQTLQKHMPNPTEDWEFEVLSIFTKRSIEELRSSF